MIKQFFCLLGLGMVCLNSKAQDTADINVKKTVIDSAVSLYYQYTDRQSRLYNGVEFLGYSPRIEGHAFFPESEWQSGSLVYDGLEYQNVPMLYDIFKDGLVVRHFNNYFRVGLVREKVKEFTIANHHFVRIEIDSLSKTPITTGFYDLLYSGKLDVLAKRVKTIVETITYQLEQKFVEEDFYYIYKDGTYYPIKNNKELLKVFKEKSKDVRQYLGKNRFRYKKDPENTIIKAAAYYDSSTK
jgi:hypothetical protein